jgi:hypothetical protein
MAKGRYWDGPEGAHRSYCVAVEQLMMQFMGERKIVPETMTPDQARDLLKEIRESDDPRIRDFNRAIFRGRVIDHLKREVLPAAFRRISYDGL